MPLLVFMCVYVCSILLESAVERRRSGCVCMCVCVTGVCVCETGVRWLFWGDAGLELCSVDWARGAGLLLCCGCVLCSVKEGRLARV
jgi:hypothetical protein